MDIAPHQLGLERVRAEYLEMPGLGLTADQVQRLCGLEDAACRSVLDSLVDAKFLHVGPRGIYTRLTDGDLRTRSRAAQAQMRAAPPAGWRRET